GARSARARQPIGAILKRIGRYWRTLAARPAHEQPPRVDVVARRLRLRVQPRERGGDVVFGKRRAVQRRARWHEHANLPRVVAALSLTQRAAALPADAMRQGIADPAINPLAQVGGR